MEAWVIPLARNNRWTRKKTKAGQFQSHNMLIYCI